MGFRNARFRRGRVYKELSKISEAVHRIWIVTFQLEVYEQAIQSKEPSLHCCAPLLHYMPDKFAKTGVWFALSRLSREFSAFNAEFRSCIKRCGLMMYAAKKPQKPVERFPKISNQELGTYRTADNVLPFVSISCGIFESQNPFIWVCEPWSWD